MATKQSASKKTTVEKTTAGAARAAQPATSRVKTVKHSKASVAEPLAVMEPVALTTARAEEPQAAIARIAYGYWVERGYQGGSQADDWYRAEAEFRQRLSRQNAPGI